MLLPVKWLKEYVDIDEEVKTLSDKLNLSGSHVESIISLDRGIKKVVVGKILNIEKHPNADRLSITKIDVGGEVLQIVTGANNIKIGDYVPVALIGARLSKGVKIGKGKLRGVESDGMLCSLKELGFEDSIIPKAQRDGIFILDKEYPLGEDINKILNLFGEVIEFEITPNRPDCLSIIGMAREVCATFGKKLNYPPEEINEEFDDIENYINNVKIVDNDLCSRYYGKAIKDVKIQSSPLWLQLRLMEAGVRPINNIVDITNYVMLEYGVPLHAFDLSKIAGREIYIRRAVEGEKITTLDGAERNLEPSDLVIADGKKPVAIAGIMGGFDTEITESTNTIFIESAQFNKRNIRLTSKRLGLRTEASSRFERGVDPNLCEMACRRVCRLAELIGVGKIIENHIDEYEKKKEKRVIYLRPERVNKILGSDIKTDNMIEILKNLELEVEFSEGRLKVLVPTFRDDLKIEVDLIEEIGRIYGFHNMKPAHLKGILTKGGKSYKNAAEDKSKEILKGLGLNEITTYSFVSPKCFDKINLHEDSIKRRYIKLINPLGEDYSVMRTTLTPNMMEILSRNFNYGVDRAYAYEIGNIFIPTEFPIKDKLPLEKRTLCIGMYGEVDFYTIKGIVEEFLANVGIKGCDYLREENYPTFHPGRTANIIYNNKVLGVLGEIHPDVAKNYDIKERTYICELDFDSIVEEAVFERKYKALPKYPAVERDIAVVINKDILVGDIEKVIWENGKDIIEEVNLFDVYTGDQILKDKKSVAFSIVYRSDKKTLTDDEVSRVHNNIIEKIEDTFDAKLRS